MTRDEIMKMQPGWELNALVAEKVMGWFLDSDIGYWRNESGLCKRQDKWSPSEDIAAAWEVWEHDRPKKWNFDLCYSDGTYLAEIYKPDDVIGVRILAQVESKSAAEAMVKCRLLALEGGEGE